jgi:hypothetical protein
LFKKIRIVENRISDLRIAGLRGRETLGQAGQTLRPFLSFQILPQSINNLSRTYIELLVVDGGLERGIYEVIKTVIM